MAAHDRQPSEDKTVLNVNGVHAANGMPAIDPTAKALPAARSAELTGGLDVVEISMAAKLAAKVQNVPSIRTDLVARIKAEITSGVYETPQRMEIAVDRLMEDLFSSTGLQ